MPVMSGIFALLFILYTAYRVLNSRTGATLLHILLAILTIISLAFNPVNTTDMSLIIGVGMLLAGVILFILESRRANPDLNHSQGILAIGVSVLFIASVLVGPAIENAVSDLTLDGVATAQDTDAENPVTIVATPAQVVPTQEDALVLATNTPAPVSITIENPLPTRYVYTTPVPTATVVNVVLCEGVVQNNLNLRANPSADAELLLTIPAGTTAPIYAQNADASWLNTGYDGREGWVSAEYVIQNADCDALPVRE